MHRSSACMHPGLQLCYSWTSSSRTGTICHITSADMMARKGSALLRTYTMLLLQTKTNVLIVQDKDGRQNSGGPVGLTVHAGAWPGSLLSVTPMPPHCPQTPPDNTPGKDFHWSLFQTQAPPSICITVRESSSQATVLINVRKCAA